MRSQTWNEAPRAEWTANARLHWTMSRDGVVAKAACALIALLAWSRLRQPKLLEQLTADSPVMRPTEARVSGGFPWRSLNTATRATPSQEIVASTILERRRDTPVANHEAAIAALVTGHARIAIAEIIGIPEADRSAAMWSDLAAAYIARGQEAGQPQLFAEAVGAADCALDLNGQLPEALFNRAVALENLGIAEPAITAWLKFLAHEPDDGWSREARRRLADLQAAAPVPFARTFNISRLQFHDGAVNSARAVTQAFPHLVRAQLLESELTSWADLECRAPAAADQQLSFIRSVAAELAIRGDTFLADYAAEIAASSGSRRIALADAQQRFARGITLAEEFPTASEKPLRDSVRELRALYEPAALYARRYLAKSLFAQNRIGESRSELLALLPLLPERKWPTLRAESLWQLALCESARANWGSSIEAFQESATLYERSGEEVNLAIVRHMLAEIYDMIGESDAAWTLRYAALRTLGHTTHMRRRSVVGAISRNAARQRKWRLALSFINIEKTLGRSYADIEADFFLRSATVHHFVADDANAADDLERARTVTASISDAALRRRAEADEIVVEALLAPTTRATIDALTMAIEFHSREGRRMHLPAFYLQRGRALQATGDHVRAARDFESGIAELESSRNTLAQENRIGVFDDAAELFACAVEEAIARRDAERAFEIAERSRARSVLDRLRATLRPIDENTVIIEPFSIDDRLILFTRTAHRVVAVAAGSSRAAIVADTEAQDDALRHGRVSEADRAARALYHALITPIEAEIAGGARLVFAPDSATAAIAFAALRNSRGRYLIEEHSVCIAPSAAVYLRTAPPKEAPRSALIVAPSGNGKRLERTHEEAGDIASSYASSQILEGVAATPAVFREAAIDAEVIHFAGHGKSTTEGASFTALLLSGNGAAVGARDIEDLELRHNPVVVLAACNTARGEARWSEGPLSVARAFLAAGASSVVATLRPIDDREAAEFFPQLHKRLAAGEYAADALRATQLEWLHRLGPQPSIWMSIQAIGR